MLIHEDVHPQELLEEAKSACLDSLDLAHGGPLRIRLLTNELTNERDPVELRSSAWPGWPSLLSSRDGRPRP